MTPDERSRAHTAAAVVLTRHVDDETTRARMASRIVDSLAGWPADSLSWILSAGVLRRADSIDVYGHAEVAELPRSAVDSAVLAATNALLKP
jgi:hypothetical protein